MQINAKIALDLLKKEKENADMVKEPVESLEERKLRLQFRRDQLLAKKAEEEAKLKQEETK